MLQKNFKITLSKYLVICLLLFGTISCSSKEDKYKITIYPSDWCFSDKENNVEFLELSTDQGHLKIFPCIKERLDTVKLDSVEKNGRLLCWIYMHKPNKSLNQKVGRLYNFWFEPEYWTMDSVNIIADIVRR